MSNESTSESADCQIVALHLGKEVYGVDIAAIHTVILPQSITPVPKAPKFIRGVMNLRGRIIPVIDLRVRFDLPALEEDAQHSSRFVIVEANGASAGLIVDSVSEVITLSADSIGPPSKLLAAKDCELVTGIGRVTRVGPKGAKKEQLILLLDVAKVLAASPFECEPSKDQKRVA